PFALSQVGVPLDDSQCCALRGTHCSLLLCPNVAPPMRRSRVVADTIPPCWTRYGPWRSSASAPHVIAPHVVALEHGRVGVTSNGLGGPSLRSARRQLRHADGSNNARTPRDTSQYTG